MSLKDLLKILYQVSLKENTSHPLIVGGVVRDKFLGSVKESFNDVDITTGDSTVFHLAKEYGITLGKYVPLTTKQAKDGHVTVYLKDFKIDFSSNFNVPNIDTVLHSMGVKHPTQMLKEIYSRDFYCNTLLMSLDFKKIKDITGEGVSDLENKLIRTCLTPDLTFKYNTNRIIRVVYLACKLGFNVDPHIIEWVKKNKQFVLESDTSYLSKNIDKALKYDADRAIYLLDKMELWSVIPITQALYPHFTRKNIKDNINVNR